MKILLIIIVSCLMNLSLATRKRKNDRATLSSSQEYRFGYQQIIVAPLTPNQDEQWSDQYFDFEIIALSLIEHLNTFELDCTPEALSKLTTNAPSDDVSINLFLEACDSQFKDWLIKKMRRLGNFGMMLRRWFNSFVSYVNSDTSNSDENLKRLLGIKDIRLAKKFSNALRNTWTRTGRENEIRADNINKPLGEETNENSRRAYYLGDGLCIHMLEPPFDRVEKFMEILLKDFEHTNHVQRIKANFHESLEIYIFQNLCRTFYVNRQNPVRSVSLAPIEEVDIILLPTTARRYIINHLKNIKNDQGDGYRCDWLGVFSRKEQYKVLNKMTYDSNFFFLKEEIDASIDELVHSCLSVFANEGVDQLYEKASSSTKERLLPAIIDLVLTAIQAYQLPFDQDINSVLDIRSSRNTIRQSFIRDIEYFIFRDQNLEFAKFAIALLSGHLGDYEDGIFREPIYNDEQKSIEYKTIEFLTHIFSIKGYKPGPKISSPLLNFYYLFKISQICNMTPIDIRRYLRSSFDSNKRRLAAADSSAPSLSQTNLEFLGQKNEDIGYKEKALNLLVRIGNFRHECTAEKLLELKKFHHFIVTSFLIKCDSQANEWLNKKMQRLDTIGFMITHWMASITTLLKEVNRDLHLIFTGDLREDNKLAKRFKNSWYNRRPILDDTFDEVYETSRRAYYVGDGICVHLLAPPLDRVEALIEVVLKEFQHLAYVRDFLFRRAKPASLKIYVFQKLCRKFSKEPRKNGNVVNREIIHPLYGIEPSKHGDLAAFEYYSKQIKINEEHKGYICHWSEVFSRKQQYRALNRLQHKKDFKTIRMAADQSFDSLVSHCLSLISRAGKDEVDKIYEKVKNKQNEEALTAVIDQLWTAIASYELPPDQSINNALDIRAPNNLFRKHLLKFFSNAITDKFYNSDKEQMSLYADLLLGHLGDFYEGIFKEPIYKSKKSIEYRTAEFLFHVFDVEGYKPQISSPLMNFYYLYKISEICAMIPFNESFKFVY